MLLDDRFLIAPLTRLISLFFGAFIFLF